MKNQLGPKPMILPMPALLVGTYGEDGTTNAMTAAWTAVCCHKPLCVGVAVRHNRLTYANLQKKKAFTLNVPKASQAASVDYLGTISGTDEPNKISIAGLETEKAQKVDAPIITSCPVNLECRVIKEFSIQHRQVFVGEVVQTHVSKALVREADGRTQIADLTQLDPIIYALDNRYYRIGEPIGVGYLEGRKLITSGVGQEPG